MKKLAFCFLLILPMLLLSGCGNKTTGNGEETFSGSMKELVEKGKPVKCTFSITEDNQPLTGTIYVAGEKKMRSDYEMTAENQTIKSSMINDGDMLYLWSDMTNQGIKMNMKEMENLEQEDTAAGGENLKEWNEKMEFKCVKWSVDKTLFETPKDMQFLDWTEMLKNFGS
jgi:outer membrane lipoprotein-sorting protein